MEMIADIRASLDAIDKKTAAGIEAGRATKEISESVTDLKSRLNHLEAVAARPQLRDNDGSYVTPEQKAHADAFGDWLRNPKSQTKMAALEGFKAVTIGSDAGGGYGVPEIIAAQVQKRLLDLSPMRQIARVETVSSSDFKMLVDINGASSGWVGEGDTRSETDTAQLGEVAPTFGIVYAYPKASEESFADIQFNVQEWLVRSVSEQLAIAEGAAFVSGDGTKKPTGFLDATPSASGDSESPARSFGQLQYVPTGNASGFGSLSVTSPEFFPADVLWTTVYSLRAGYRANARWVMNSATAGVIRKFKDADGNYLWRDMLAAGQPPLLCGYEVVIDENMPDVSANAYPVAFGDFQRGYLICDSFGFRVTVDDNVTTPGQLKFYARKRVGGKTLDDNAIKLIKIAAS
ncbi:phage major capsid protein [Maricaulis sp.]|uniref:phage major capsid protein n=1 Tax=Maricaulis sp. TaxID=1486257 RepID=UPI003A8EA279